MKKAVFITLNIISIYKKNQQMMLYMYIFIKEKKTMLEHLVMSYPFNGKFSRPDIIPTENKILLYVPLSDFFSLFIKNLQIKSKVTFTFYVATTLNS